MYSSIRLVLLFGSIEILRGNNPPIPARKIQALILGLVSGVFTEVVFKLTALLFALDLTSEQLDFLL
jgi:hypothetical protein